MVHQHFQLVPTLTVTENMILGSEVTRGAFLDRRKAAAQIRKLSAQYGLEVDPDALVGTLPVGVQQRVEILKMLYRQADILILDEPTAVLTPQEADELFVVMKSLVESGKSIIFITHKLKEVLAVADHITVLRGGRVAGTTTPQESDELQLAALMVGREVLLTVEKETAQPGEVVLQVQDLHALDNRFQEAMRGVSLDVYAGEVLGIAGVQGNGQTELVEVLTGLRQATGGRVLLLGQDVTNRPPRTITEAGVAHIPEDRQKDGLVLTYPILDNLILNTYYLPPFARGALVEETAIVANAKELVQTFDVRTPSIYLPASNLSGGNQQKVIVARELSRPVRLLIAAQPTRGLDVGSIEFIHSEIIQMRDQGAAVLLVSAELDEIMALSDRVAVMFEGRVVAIVDREQATRGELGLLMAGSKTA
jgi:simple sugar transport system ATP-binding protein